MKNEKLKLSESEHEALNLLRQRGGSMPITDVPEKNERDVVFKTIIPGLTTYRKLEKKGLVIITEEEPIMDVDPSDPLYGFEFTPTIELVRQA